MSRNFQEFFLAREGKQRMGSVNGDIVERAKVSCELVELAKVPCELVELAKVPCELVELAKVPCEVIGGTCEGSR